MDKPAFSRWTLGNFVGQLADGTPLPGGGCAVALAGALAAALGSLSARIIAKRPAPAHDPAALPPLLARLQEHQDSFLELIDADALAYQQVVQARRLPRNTPAAAAHRQQAIDAAYLRACDPPRRLAAQALDLLRGALDLAAHESPVVLADIGVMGFLAVAVIHGALINILSNLSMVPPGPVVQAVYTEAAGVRATLDNLAPSFTTAIYGQVRTP